MDLDYANVNWLAILLAGVASLVLGGLWYSPLMFSKPWQSLAGLTDEAIKANNPARAMSLMFVVALVSAYVIALIVQLAGVEGWMDGAMLGLLGALAFSLSSGIGLALFEARPMALVAINHGYYTLLFALQTAIIAGM